MDKSTLFHFAAPGKLPERAVFVASVVAMLMIFVANILIADVSLRLYVLYVLPLLAIGMHSSRRSLYFAGALWVLFLEAVSFAYFGLSIGSLAGNLVMESVVVVLCLSVADTARESYLRMLDLARTDDLTGLLNRRAFVRAAALEIERQARYGGEFSIILLDLDGFKELNDTYGHFIGDAALRTLAEAIRNSTRRSDVVARIGGDEFVVLMPNTPMAACAVICGQLRSAVADGMKDSGYAITASIGSVTFEHPPESVEAALQRADEAMYRAKHNGGDCVVSA
ncbi:MAG: GGDEF domain-containing protein [Gammaproteobacteria bacterium]|nr:GGDEF domain-containing protein [Gammaproteobacteria bacterium]MBU1415211.1 GGDEF domain-containing protein [Gammaproteobacteria bacterium]